MAYSRLTRFAVLLFAFAALPAWIGRQHDLRRSACWAASVPMWPRDGW